MRSIRLAEGAIPFPAPAKAPAVEWTGADELLITTITHDHADRLRSYAPVVAGTP